MTSQRNFIWLEYARLYKKDQKETWNNIVETTLFYQREGESADPKIIFTNIDK